MAILTLYDVATPILTNPEDQMGYLIMFMFKNPGYTSNFYDHMLISLRKITAEYEDNPVAVATAIQSKLTNIFNRVLPGYDFNIDCLAKKVNDKIRIMIEIKDSTGREILPSTIFETDEDGQVTFKARNVIT